MLKTPKSREAWSTIIIFLFLLTLFSAFAYYAILRLNPTSIYVGALMISPSIAAFLTLRIKKRPIASLPWGIKELKYLRLAYFIPLLYVTLAYIAVWILGFGELINLEQISEWSKELGITETKRSIVVLVMIILLLTVGVIKNIGSTLGEEIGWRGFLIFELRKVMSFSKLAFCSGIIWAIWHFPIIHLIYGRGDHFWFHTITFTVMILGVSVILAYYTFKSKSLWPAAIFHSVHNSYIQKICTPITVTNESSRFWIDEYGVMIPIITSIFAIYFWRKAIQEDL